MPKGIYPRRRGIRFGRRSVLTPELLDQFAKMLPTVFFLETVGDLLGVHRTTWRLWLRRGRKEADRLAKDDTAVPDKAEHLYLSFFYTYRQGIAARAQKALEAIDAAASTDWRAAAWLLERGHPDLWGSHAKDIAELKRQVAALAASVQRDSLAASASDGISSVGNGQ